MANRDNLGFIMVMFDINIKGFVGVVTIKQGFIQVINKQGLTFVAAIKHPTSIVMVDSKFIMAIISDWAFTTDFEHIVDSLLNLPLAYHCHRIFSVRLR